MNLRLINDEQAWEIAAVYSNLIKTIPDRVGYLLRVLREEHAAGVQGDAVSPNCLNYIREIDKLRPLKEPIAAGVARLYPDETPASDSSRALLGVVGPGMFAALLICVWYYRRLGKIINPEIWERYSEIFLADVELGYEIGKAVPELGAVDGFLFSAIRAISLGTFAIQDHEQFGRYLNLHKGKTDLAYEHERYNCDHAQIGVYLLQAVYMLKTRPDGNRFDASLLEVREAFLGRIASESLVDPWLRRCAAGIKGISLFYEETSDFSWLTEFGASAQSIARITEVSINLRSGVRSFEWLNRGQQE